MDQIKKIEKLVQKYLSRHLRITEIVGTKFIFRFKDKNNIERILGAKIISWHLLKETLYLDTSSPSISYLAINKKEMYLVGVSSGERYNGKISIH